MRSNFKVIASREAHCFKRQTPGGGNVLSKLTLNVTTELSEKEYMQETLASSFMKNY